jgi:hypothetical protein
MRNKEYRTWRIIVLILNILIHVSIFLSLTNFKISNLRRRYPSYFEFASFSEGKGTNPSHSGASEPKPATTEKVEEKKEIPEQKVSDQIVRVDEGGIKVFEDSATNKSRSDSLKSNELLAGTSAGDSSEIKKTNNTQAGDGMGNGEGTRTNIQMPRFMGGDSDKFSDWVLSHYTLFTENFKGTVIVEFIVDRNGDIKDLTIANCDNKKIRAELTRIIQKAPRWTPAKNGNRSKDIHFTLPFNFIEY